MKKYPIHKIFDIVRTEPNFQKSQEFLLMQNSPALREVVIAGFYDDLYQWDLPSGCPAFKRAEDYEYEFILYQQYKRLKYFNKFHLQFNPIPQLKKETIFLDMMEMIHAKDAELLIALKDKTYDFGFFTKDLTKVLFDGRVQSSLV